MKTHKFIFDYFPAIIAIAMVTGTGMTEMATADEQKPEEIAFLQDIQDRLIQVSGIKNRDIALLVTENKKRKITITPSSISLSYGFLKQMKNINQLVATMAHMTTHISLDYVATPPLPEGAQDAPEKSSVTDYIKSAVRPKYPDQSNIPQATGAFHHKGAEIIARPSYQNKDYDYSVNKADIISAEHELEVDKITDKILRHSGFCPSDYSRLLHYFYENPQQVLGNKHFVLSADGWQRIDAINRRADPASACDEGQIAQTIKYAADFDRLTVRVMSALNKKD